MPDKRRTKLDDKNESFIFIGYDNNSKGYKLYNPNNGKIVINRDVIFDEEGECDWGPHDKDYNFAPNVEEEEQAIINGARRRSSTSAYYSTRFANNNH